MYRVLVLIGLGIQLRTGKNMSNQNKNTIYGKFFLDKTCTIYPGPSVLLNRVRCTEGAIQKWGGVGVKKYKQKGRG